MNSIRVADDILHQEGYTTIVSQDGQGGVILRNDQGEFEHFEIRDSYSGWSIPTLCGKVLEFCRTISNL